MLADLLSNTVTPCNVVLQFLDISAIGQPGVADHLVHFAWRALAQGLSCRHIHQQACSECLLKLQLK